MDVEPDVLTVLPEAEPREDDDYAESDPIPVQPLEPEFPLTDDQETMALRQARFRIYVANPQDFQIKLAAEYINAKPLKLPLEQAPGSFNFQVVADADNGPGYYIIKVTGQRGTPAGNTVLLLIKLKPVVTGRRKRAGVAIARLSWPA